MGLKMPCICEVVWLNRRRHIDLDWFILVDQDGSNNMVWSVYYFQCGDHVAWPTVLNQLKHLLRTLCLGSFVNATWKNRQFKSSASVFSSVSRISILLHKNYKNTPLTLGCLMAQIPGWYVDVCMMICGSMRDCAVWQRCWVSPSDCWVFCSSSVGTGEVWELEHLLWGSHQQPDTSLAQVSPLPKPPGFHSSKGKGSSLDLKVSYVR